MVAKKRSSSIIVSCLLMIAMFLGGCSTFDYKALADSMAEDPANDAWDVSISFPFTGTYEIRFIAIDTFFNFTQQIITIDISSS